MASVEHPHVARIHSFGETAGVVHIVMEHVAGESLAERIRGGRLPITEAARRRDAALARAAADRCSSTPRTC